MRLLTQDIFQWHGRVNSQGQKHNGLKRIWNVHKATAHHQITAPDTAKPKRWVNIATRHKYTIAKI